MATTGNDGGAPAKLGAVTILGVVLTCCAVAILEGFDIQAIGIAAPKLVPALGLTPAQAGQAFGLGQFGLVAGTLIGGWLSDRIGRKAVLMTSVIVFGIFTLTTLVANSFNLLVAVRVATGLGLGGAMPNMIRMALDAAGAKNRAFTVTAVMAGTPLGGAIVSLFARLYMQQLGWHSLFWLGGALPLILVPLVAMLPRQVSAKSAKDSAEPRINGFKALFGERRVITTLLLWLANFLTLIVLYLFLNWLPSLMSGLGLPLAVGQEASLVFNLGSVVGCLLIGFTTDRLGARGPLSVAYIGLIGAVAGLAYFRQVEQMLICASLCGFFELGAQYALSGVGPMYYPRQCRGLATGAALAVGRVGSIVGPMLAGGVLSLGVGPKGVLALLVPVAILAGISVFAVTTIARAEHD